MVNHAEVASEFDGSPCFANYEAELFGFPNVQWDGQADGASLNNYHRCLT